MNKNNMLTGRPARVMVAFALPMILGNLFQQLYAIVDTIIVGRVLGQNALSAVGSTATICTVFVSIAMGLSVGCTIVFSQLFGAHYYSRLKTAIYTAIITFFVLSLIITGFSLLTAGGMLKLINTNELIYEDAKLYFMIYILGVPALYIYNIANSTFNSLGKSVMTLGLLTGSSVLNIFLDLWFIKGLGMGVDGAAIATDISQYLAAAVAIICLIVHVNRKFKTEEKTRLFEFRLLGNMAKVAIPTMLSQAIVSISYVALQSLVNSFNNIALVAGYVSATKVDSICVIPMVQIGNALSTFTGQNVGAYQYDRVSKGLKAALAMVGTVCAIFIPVIWLFGKDLIGMFMEAGKGADAIEYGFQYLAITGTFYVMMGLMYSFLGVLRGSGAAMISVIVTLSNFAVRLIFSYVMVWITGSQWYIWWSSLIGWTLAIIWSACLYRSGMWKKKRLADKV